MDLMKDRDTKYLAVLRDYYAKNGVLPSFATIAKLVGLRSTSGVSALVARLKSGNFLTSTSDRRLAPGPDFFARPIPDTVRGGSPSPANEGFAEVVSIDRLLIANPSRTILLSLRGDSMVDAGLMPGDSVVVAKGAPAKPGDVVVAFVDNEFTVKYLAQDKRGFYLRPANKAYEPIRPRNHLDIFGLVVGSFRKY